MSALVKLEDVSKRYGDAIALYLTNLSVESGKTTELIGPSGCGNSTFLRLVIRLIEAASGALDPLVRASLQKDLKEVFTRLAQTVLFVTHDLAEAIYFADAIVLMNEGRIVQKGTITDLRERPADPFVSEFINAQRGIATV